jgi:hypothetical protein
VLPFPIARGCAHRGGVAGAVNTSVNGFNAIEGVKVRLTLGLKGIKEGE